MPKIDWANVVGGIGRGVGSLADAYRQSKANEILQNPNATPMQQAMAFAQLGQNQSAAQVIKQGGIQKVQADIAKRFPDLSGGVGGGAQTVPGATPTIVPMTVTGATRQPPNAQIPDNVVNAIEGIPPQVQPQEMPVNQSDQVQQPVIEGPEQKLAKAQQFRQRAEAYNAAGLTPQANTDLSQANSLENQAIAQEKLQRADERETRKETQKYVDKILDSYQGAKTSEAILGQMEELSGKGNLSTPAMNTLLNKIGIPIGILNNPDSEEFDKLANTLTRDIQKFYGARILASEFQNFLKQIPTLNNSPEGRKRIIDNLNTMLNPAKFEYEAYKQIIRENGGKRPPDLRERVMDRMEPLLDQWATEFKQSTQSKDININLPPVQSGKIRMTKGGRTFDFPADQFEIRKQQGFAAP